MNQKYTLFWNLGRVWKLDLKTKELTKLGLYISEKETETRIVKVRTCSNKNTVCIRVRQSPTQDCMIKWNLEKDLEITSFDIDQNALYFQDRVGNSFLAEKDYVINLEMGCKLKCYHFKISDFNTENIKFKFMYGHRVDDINHNFVLFRNYINLSFSYMTFVIKDNFDKHGYIVDDFVFDPEGYDFVLNKNSTFTEGNLATQHYEKLNFILDSYQKIDPNLLEALYYTNEKGQMPLHLAVQANNNRMVNLILKYMANIRFTPISSLKGIFKELVNFQGFADYLEKVPRQTVQMINKQTIMLKEREDDDIIAV